MAKEILISGILVACALSCTSNQTNEQLKTRTSKERIMENDTLKLIISPTYNSDISYGSIFACKIIEVSEGQLTQDSIPLLTIKAEYTDYLQAHASPGTCTVTLVKKQENVQENRLAINGFVDKNKVAWEVVSIQ